MAIMIYARGIMLFAVALLIGCAPAILVTKEYSDDSFSFGQIKKDAKVTAFVSQNVNVMEFKKAFAKEYQSSAEFSGAVCRQLTDSLKFMAHCAAVMGDSLQNYSMLLSATLDQKSIDQTRSFFESSDADYFFVIRSVDISNSVSNSAPMYLGGGAGGTGVFVGGGSTESCVVAMHADLWNVKEKKKILSYTAVGQSTVFMLFFKTALKDAITQSIRLLVNYIATGATH
jgi:hypothetical protein